MALARSFGGGHINRGSFKRLRLEQAAGLERYDMSAFVEPDRAIPSRVFEHVPSACHKSRDSSSGVVQYLLSGE
jgi:hypothetical protein